MSQIPSLIDRPDEAATNIFTFESELKNGSDASLQLRGRLGQFHAFYAMKDSDGAWKFGPSKFVGYRNNSAENYMKNAGRDREDAPKGGADGRQTERRLAKWFVEVDRRSKLGRELFEKLDSFLSEFGGAARKGVRLNVMKSDIESHEIVAATKAALTQRISVDPLICSGRPCVAGTRMRVADILSMLAGGATKKEILADFPYLESEDISAALSYAARATGHRVIEAA
jgi:uncharacterized protein (DUF433 family)